MLYISLFFISTLFCNGLAADWMRASFFSSDSGVQGNVTVEDSIITLLLDLTTILGNGNLPSGCDSAQGFLFHVHSDWTHSSITNAYGSNCNATFVGSHYDPYGACSSKSDNPACTNNAGCIDSTYDCTSTTYNSDAYSCEIGDWSGKYGTLFLSGSNLTATVQSFGDITGNQLEGKSLVFHCANNKVAAFCAKFQPTSGLVFGTAQRQTNGFSLKADFSSALGISSNKKAFIAADYTGQVQFKFDKGVFQNLVTPCSSDLYKIWIGNSWTSTNMAEVSCDSSIYGTFFDPTNQCYADTNTTDSPYCVQGELCDGSGYTYKCNFTEDPFSCSPSDFSGRYGTIDVNTVSSSGLTKSISDRYLGDLSSLPHKSLVLLCSDNNLPMACAKLQNTGIGTSAATFAQNAQGFVRVKDGEITVSVSLNKTQTLYAGTLLPSDCFDNGAYIHIHEKWTYADTADRVGPTACNSTFTGGHWDPWAACGPSTGNTAVCQKTPSPSPTPACIQKTYHCNSTNYKADPFACEVGDWSGKYGVYDVTGSTYQISRTNHSYLEVDASALIGRSVVIHCTSTGGPRAVCAPFVLQQGLHDGEDTQPQYSLQDETGNLIYNATVTLDNNGGSIELKSTGAFYVNFDVADDTQCSSTISYGVFNDASCQFLYDPTIQCPPKSEYNGTLCTNGKTCDTTSSYECSFSTDQYTCSPSDLSGRYGLIGTDKKAASSGYDDLMVPLKSLRTKYFGLFCSDTLTVIQCHPWDVAVQATAHPTMTPTLGPTEQPTPPTHTPTVQPTTTPTKRPTTPPTAQPSMRPTDLPTLGPTSPTAGPTELPTAQPTSFPTTRSPTGEPTMSPTNMTVTMLNTTFPNLETTAAATEAQAKSVNRIAIGVGMWIALLGLFWV